MTDINLTFCRALLKAVLADVKPHTTVAERADAWVIKTGRDSWEFHGPREFYWYGSADNAFDARAQGWQAWLAKFHPEETDG